MKFYLAMAITGVVGWTIGRGVFGIPYWPTVILVLIGAIGGCLATIRFGDTNWFIKEIKKRDKKE